MYGTFLQRTSKYSVQFNAISLKRTLNTNCSHRKSAIIYHCTLFGARNKLRLVILFIYTNGHFLWLGNCAATSGHNSETCAQYNTCRVQRKHTETNATNNQQTKQNDSQNKKEKKKNGMNERQHKNAISANCIIAKILNWQNSKRLIFISLRKGWGATDGALRAKLAWIVAVCDFTSVRLFGISTDVEAFPLKVFSSDRN